MTSLSPTRSGEGFRPGALLVTLLLSVATVGCSSFAYDLTEIDIEVSVKPEPAGSGARVEPFSIETKNVLYVHGLFGEKIPDIRELLAEETAGADRIRNFRVRRFGNFWDWLGTHLSLSLVRLKTVVIEGDAVYD